MVAHQEKELQRLAKENAEKFLLKHAVIGSYLNLNKKIANQYKWTFELKHEEEGPCGKRRRGNSGQTQPDHDGQDPGPIPMGQLVDPLSAAGPWMPLHSIAEAEALKLTSVPPVLQRNSAPTPGVEASASNPGLPPAGPQITGNIPHDPSESQSLSSISDDGLEKVSEAADAAVKEKSARLKSENARAEKLSAGLDSCRASMYHAEKRVAGFKRLAAAQQAYAIWEASLPAPGDVLNQELASIFALGFSEAATKMKEAEEKQLTALGLRSNMTTDQIRTAGKRMDKSLGACKADIAKRQSLLREVQQGQARLKEELALCKIRSQELHQEWLSRS